MYFFSIWKSVYMIHSGSLVVTNHVSDSPVPVAINAVYPDDRVQANVTVYVLEEDGK